MSDPILVVVFLRGGMDGLNLISPSGDADFIAARPDELRVARSGDGAGLVLSEQAADVDFRFHLQAKGLHDLFEAGDLAVIHAAGLTDGTRSHFDAEARMERAAPNGSAGGWLGRYLTATNPDGMLPSLAVGSTLPDSLDGASQVAVAQRLTDLIVAEGWDIAPLLMQRLVVGFGSHQILGASVSRLKELSEILRDRMADDGSSLGEYAPDVEYPWSPLSQSLMSVAQTIKLGLGLRVATVDYGGWDTHVDQAREFPERVDALSGALHTFWRDLGDHQDNTTVVVMSEFGRRLRANESRGTDHGFGNAMMVMGPNVAGRQMHGRWPGLANDALDAGADLDITTDYRTVLAEVMGRHMGFDDVPLLFPGFDYAPTGVFRA